MYFSKSSFNFVRIFVRKTFIEKLTADCANVILKQILIRFKYYVRENSFLEFPGCNLSNHIFKYCLTQTIMNVVIRSNCIAQPLK